MFCPKCGKMNPDSEAFCSGCNAALHEEKEEMAPKKTGKAAKIILAVLIVIVAAVVVTMSLSGCQKTPINPEEKMEISF